MRLHELSLTFKVSRVRQPGPIYKKGVTGGRIENDTKVIDTGPKPPAIKLTPRI
jgi:hypothetical protein